MSRLFFLVITITILSFSSVVYAAKNEAGSQGSSQNTINQIQNQNEVQTQNQGEDLQIQTNTQEQESKDTTKSASPRSETAKENMSAVSQKVEELLTTQTEKGGIGEQVSQIAQEQKQAQDKIQSELGKIDSRKGLLRLLVGPDYHALKNMQKQMEQNQLRIRQLEQLQNQLTNQGDIIMVKETIQALTEQNVALQDRITLEERSGSLLGWFFKLFAK
jgi:hypothetical protein